MNEPAIWTEEEIRSRVGQMIRLFSAWPSMAKGLTRRTVLTYVDATRGVPMAELPKLVELVIGVGGEFPPSAGDVVRRWAKEIARRKKRGYSAYISAEEREARDAERALERFRETWRLRPSLLDPGPVPLSLVPDNVTELADRIGKRA